MQDERDITELERRINAALGRIGKGFEGLSARAEAAAAPKPAVEPSEIARIERLMREKDAEIRKLRDALEAEKASGLRMAEKLQTLRDQATAASPGQLQARVDKMTQQLDVQGLELRRARKTTIQLREQLRLLQEAAAQGATEPQLINKAMMAELEALRASRHLEIAEMDEILAELEPLIEEVRLHG